mgnify:CR=1 FL=1
MMARKERIVVEKDDVGPTIEKALRHFYVACGMQEGTGGINAQGVDVKILSQSRQ